ncbi:hypothetical protein D0860_05681 [Hortaea werneckii]|uniref:Uncharacterized protein n=1 Tax=Hortaea werneckii TaxID=91943 RepID=A0A3M7GZ73_HORWE|nr:hypothetical protein D0860_05681 [Hortaea werneckii]
MNQTTAQRSAEHRDILKGLDAQISRLEREEDELFGRIIRAKDREDAQVVFDALAKVKGQKDKAEILKKEEMGSFERWGSQHQLQALRGTRSANMDKHQNATLPPFSTDVIDLSFDEDDEEPVKREASVVIARSRKTSSMRSKAETRTRFAKRMHTMLWEGDQNGRSEGLEGNHNEHQKVMDGFGAQIGRLDRKLHALRDQLIAAGDAVTVDRLSDERASTKKQKAELEKLQQDELAKYNRALLKAHTGNLPAAVHQNPALEETLRPSQKEIIDLTQDDILPTIKSEGIEISHTSGPNTNRPYTRCGPQSFPDQEAQQVAQNQPQQLAKKATLATSSSHIDDRRFHNFQAIADSHPTLVPCPDGPGAVEMRCPECGCNAVAKETNSGGYRGFFAGARGLQLHVRVIHKSSEFCKRAGDAAAAVRDCTYDYVPQGVVDAIKSGDTEAYVVPLIQVPYGALRPLQTGESPGNV